MTVAETAPGAGTPVHDFYARPLLLVIDQSADAAGLSGLLGSGVHVRICSTAAEGLIVAGGTRPDVVLAAADVADVPCPTLVRLLRRWCGTPVIVGTDGAHGDVAGSVLQAGAAACVARPYRPAEVLAFVRSLGLHTAAPEEPELRCGALVLDPGGRTVRLRGSVIDMPPRELRLLHFLMSHPGRVVSRAQLWQQVWGGAGSATSNTVAVHVRRLRSRLGDDPRHPTILTTVGRSGYRLHPPSEVRMS
jgi:DNA-binding response OmpR family regulator